MPDTHSVGWVPSQLEDERFTSSSSNSENRFVPSYLWIAYNIFSDLVFCDSEKIICEGSSSGRAGDNFWWLSQGDKCDQEGGGYLNIFFTSNKFSQNLFPQWPEQNALIESANWEIPGYATGVYHVLVHNGKVLSALCWKQLWITSKGDVGTGKDHRRLRRAQRRLLCGEEHQGNECVQQSIAIGGHEKLSSCLGESLPFLKVVLYPTHPGPILHLQWRQRNSSAKSWYSRVFQGVQATGN